MPEIGFGGSGNFHGAQKTTFERLEQIWTHALMCAKTSRTKPL
jgi:hypothetical protein